MKSALRPLAPAFWSFAVGGLLAAVPACSSSESNAGSGLTGGAGKATGGTGQGGSNLSVGGSSGDAAGPSSGGSGGGIAVGGSGGSGASGGSSAGTGSAEMCGDSACADHSGTKDFTGGDATADAADTFDDATAHEPGTDPGREPAIVYPSHETMFPINVSHIRHDWAAGGTNALFRLRFVGPETTVNVYTTDATWEPDEEQWDWIAESNRGQAVSLTVAGLDPAAPGDVWQSEAITLYFSDAEVEGAIYYWSTGTQGIMRALISDPIPIKFYTDPAAEDAGTCVACHTLSRDGKRLAVGYGGETLREVNVPDRETLVPPDGGKGMASAWTTFSPDGEMLLVAAGGKLTLIDSDTGETIGDNGGVVPIPAGTVATHPDWSALGDRVAITLGTKGGNKEVEGGSIAILPYDAGVWGEPEIIVPSAGGMDNNFFPVFSPDSRHIAYVNAAGKSKDALSATLRLVPAGGGDPVVMTRLNERVSNEDGVTGIGNSMPTWAPSTRPGIFWLAFSSLRAYSVVRPQDAKEDQIWIAAVDPMLADPGYAGFWAPFQNIDAGNHRAFWTHADEDVQCGCHDVCGDSLDNDCNGTADDDQCVSCAPEEICGDGIDNDCNCVVDDCQTEICDDGIDNDGDGAIDADDRACVVVK
jgi:hypothetical protein